MLSAKTPDWLDNTIEFASNAYFLFFLIGLTNKLYEKPKKRSSVIVWSTINSSFFRRNYYTVVAAIYKATTQGTLFYVCGPENYCDYKSITAFSHFFIHCCIITPKHNKGETEIFYNKTNQDFYCSSFCIPETLTRANQVCGHLLYIVHGRHILQ